MLGIAEEKACEVGYTSVRFLSKLGSEIQLNQMDTESYQRTIEEVKA
jgi:hypothetical protein